ncbi:hypothetical protein [Luedemannella helvata]|uniref:Uncharacterized protein n=1 Tax=Luedemannella helvata TaxID=349315 RepID=A0ABN2KZI8_9ACTN
MASPRPLRPAPQPRQIRSPGRGRPVFVDRTGRRLRLTRLVGVGVAVLLAATLGMLAFALSGAPAGTAPDLPGAAGAGVTTRPAARPTTAAPTRTPTATRTRPATSTTRAAARTTGTSEAPTSRPGRAPTHRGKPTDR